MSIIAQISTSNTFSQWLTATQTLIGKVNDLTDSGPGGPGSLTFYANTNLAIANNVTIGGDLTVSGNITLDEIGFDNLHVNGSATVANTLSVGGSATLSNTLLVVGDTNLSVLNVESANVTTFIGTANTNIYNAIANISSSVGAESIAFAIALG